ncbi:hypothetical protein [Ensifer sp. 4252]|uniref:hypothetical protein n=1 Tax=Ensifer sp. 4252 TaxID=3373915 RepID=UPI003D25009F
MGLEGIVAKRRAKPYRSGRKPEWLKIQSVRRDGIATVGYELLTARARITRFLLATRKGNSPV